MVCEDRAWGYWAGLDSVWDTDHTLVNVEHDMEFSDELVAELLSCPHDRCAYPYVVRPVGWPGATYGASYGSLWVTEGQPYASFSSVGFCKLTAAARAGSTLQRCLWSKVEGSIHLACIRGFGLWHLHWPAIQHHHDYTTGSGTVPDTGDLYSLVKWARDQGHLQVYGDPLTDECLENLKRNDPLIYDQSLRELAEGLCVD